jgi:hypothetical protein
MSGCAERTWTIGCKERLSKSRCSRDGGYYTAIQNTEEALMDKKGGKRKLTKIFL